MLLLSVVLAASAISNKQARLWWEEKVCFISGTAFRVGRVADMCPKANSPSAPPTLATSAQGFIDSSGEGLQAGNSIISSDSHLPTESSVV